MQFNTSISSRKSDSGNASFGEKPDRKAISVRGCRVPFWVLAFCLSLAWVGASRVQAQTAVAPTAGDGLTTATAYQITELGNLVWLGERAAANQTSGTYYTLMNDIDASETATWNDEETTGTDVLEGFKPIGTYTVPTVPDVTSFRGVFDGNGKKITGLTITRFQMTYVGLFGSISRQGIIRNLTLEDCSISGDSNVGSIVGYLDRGRVENCVVSGIVSGTYRTGGLVGHNNIGIVRRCSVKSSVMGRGLAGGLVGQNVLGTVEESDAYGLVSGVSYVGGGVGKNDSGHIVNSSAYGNVEGRGSSVGGLIGFCDGDSIILNSSAYGNVEGVYYVGGLVGDCDGGSIINGFATGSVAGGSCVGGVIGINNGQVASCFAVGTITGNQFTGGVVGQNIGTVTASYWDKETTGKITSVGSDASLGKTTTEMKQQATFAGWDFTTVWGIYEGRSYPYLLFSPAPFHLQTSVKNAGSVVANPSGGTYEPGTTVTLTAQPDARYRLVKWTGGPVADPTTLSTTVLMDAHKNVTASFELNEYRLTLKTTNGSITKSPDQTTYTYGTVVTLTAIPDAGYHFTGWAGDVANPTSPTTTIFMAENKTITANFMRLYEIHTLAELQAVAVNNLSGYYRLMNDIDASNTAGWNDAGTTVNIREGFRPISFKGIFDGQGHKITGLTINRPDMDYVGLFGYIGAGNEIRNLTLEGGTVTGKDYVGGLAGNISESSIQKCSSSATVKGGSLVGGLVGTIYYSTAVNVFASGEVTASGDAGGLSGKIESSSRISNAVASGPVRSKGRYLHVGGLAGSVGYSAITGGVARGTVTIEAPETDNYVGGLIGENFYSEVTSCSATGSVTGKGDSPNSFKVGGLIGSNSGEVTSCSATGPVMGENSSLTVGGLIGSNSSKVSFCTASGEVTGKSVSLDEGGLIGRNTGTVTHCSATGSVITAISAEKGISLSVGGLIGYNLSSISNSFSNGRVASQMSYSSQQSAGGLVGYNKGPVQLCYATGLVTQDGEYGYTGGLVGQNLNAITNCYATGAIKSGGVTGGLVGYQNKGKISNSFATGPVSGKSCSLIGDTPGTSVTACYWDVESSGQVASAGGAGAVGWTTAEMQRQATFQPGGGAGATDWDFTSIWGIVEGQSYPYLRAFESAPPQFRLNVSVQGNGAVALDPPGGMYAPGTTVTLTATPDAGAHFADWTGAVAERTAASSTIVMNTHKSVSARFLSAYEIRTLAELQAVATGDLGGYYTLMNDLDASETATWNDAGTTEGLLQGFRPIGVHTVDQSTTASFHGVFEGNGKKILGLTINRSSSDGTGLFGCVGAGGEVRNLTLEGGTVKGSSSVGGLTGYNRGLIENCIVSTAVTGSSQYVGGLVGSSGGSAARILNCIATGPVTGPVPGRYIGGLGGGNSGLVSGCVATGEVVCKQGSNIGGLIGENDGGRITHSSAIGAVTTQWATQIGGLVGHNYYGSVSDSYAQGAVTGSGSIGGLVGLNEGASLTNCFATGWVAGNQSAYNTGGLVGKDTTNKVTACYWDVETTGRTKSAGGTGAVGRSTAEMKRQATFQPGGVTGATDWDFTSVWGIIEGQTYPYLRSASYSKTFYLSIAVSEGQGTVTPDSPGNAYAPGTVVTLTATASPGYHFAGWAGGPVADHTDASTSLLMDGHKVVTARFLPSYEIRTLDELQAIATGDLSGYYTLMNDLDASDTANWNDEGPTTGTEILEGFRPIGVNPSYPLETVSFRGVFDGNGKKITGLTINRSGMDYVGLFGCLGTGGEIWNLTLKEARVTGKDLVGGLVGLSASGVVTHCTITGSVTGNQNVGGLVGYNQNKIASISSSFSEATVTGVVHVGGLLGFHAYGTLSNNVASGAVTGNWNVGGLVGCLEAGLIVSCSATGPVKGTTDYSIIGGLVGESGYMILWPKALGRIVQCFATGPVTGGQCAGGLVGDNMGTIENCFATGRVTATSVDSSSAGGLIGSHSTGAIINCFATGAVTGPSRVGGLAGSTYIGSFTNCFAAGAVTGTSVTAGLIGNNQTTTITACYWDKETTGQTASIGSDARFGKTTAEMKQQATFQPDGGTGATDWDLTSVWGIVEGQSYPYLRFMPPPFRLSVAVEGPGAFTLNPSGDPVLPPETGFTYAPGTTVTLTAGQPGTGHHFAEWIGAVPDPKTTSSAILLMDTHRSATAVFAPNECTLILGPTVHGSILKSPDRVTYPYGSTVTLTPKPDAGYCFTGWTGDVPPMSKPWQVPLVIEIRGDTTLSARFEPIRHSGVWMVR
jgi:uncharacterized repeat protein (TIGR02543 family)